jgi:hypothetical protein
MTGLTRQDRRLLIAEPTVVEVLTWADDVAVHHNRLEGVGPAVLLK